MGAFIVNTNDKYYDGKSTEDMINNSKAWADYVRKKTICRIQKDDLVFLYKNKVGIIAYGNATGNLLIENSITGDPNEQYSMPLEQLTMLKIPMSIQDIRTATGKANSIIRGTVIEIREEDIAKIYDYIQVNCL